jgi:hypothetical protein
MDKTTVLVGTGNTKFWPVYFTLTGIHNDMQQAHQDALVPMAFLCIPKGVLIADVTCDQELMIIKLIEDIKKRLHSANFASGCTTHRWRPSLSRCGNT